MKSLRNIRVRWYLWNLCYDLGYSGHLHKTVTIHFPPLFVSDILIVLADFFCETTDEEIRYLDQVDHPELFGPPSDEEFAALFNELNKD